VTLKDVLSITALSADSNSVVYVSTENTAGQAIVHALNFTDGTELWKMSLNDDKATLGVGAAVPTPDSSILVLVGPNIHRYTKRHFIIIFISFCVNFLLQCLERNNFEYMFLKLSSLKSLGNNEIICVIYRIALRVKLTV
jgi:hypothetical protein